MLTRSFGVKNFGRYCATFVPALTLPAPSKELFNPRLEFELPVAIDRKQWYPKHMSIQLKRMEGKLRSVDLIVEVHDARIALTGRNPHFHSKLYAVRPHILVLNKMDLIDLNKYRKPIEDYYRGEGIENIIWTNCKDSRKTSKALTTLQDTMRQCLQAELRFNRAVKTEYQVMIVGIPNVGKSSLINALRHNNLGLGNKAATEGSRPGVTIRVQNRIRILDRPPLYILDTPGVLYPYMKENDVESVMKLALCNLILESATQPFYVADFMLYFMNKYSDLSYLELVGLTEATNDIRKVLVEICKRRNMKRCVRIGNHHEERWDFDGAAAVFIKLFRTKKIADLFLDRNLLMRVSA